MPELDDDMVKDSTEFDTVDEYKADVKKKLEEANEKHADSEVEAKIFDKVIENMTAEIPQVMFDNRVNEMIGKFTGNNTSACGFSIGFERIVMLLLERNYEIPTKNGKKAYLIEKNMPADKMLTILKQAQEERNAGTQINISIMKKNKKFQKDQMTAEGYTEFVEFFRDRV